MNSKSISALSLFKNSGVGLALFEVCSNPSIGVYLSTQEVLM